MMEIFSSCVAVFKITQVKLKTARKEFRMHHFKSVEPCICSDVQEEPKFLYLCCDTKFHV